MSTGNMLAERGKAKPMTPEQLEELERLANRDSFLWSNLERRDVRNALPALIAAARKWENMRGLLAQHPDMCCGQCSKEIAEAKQERDRALVEAREAKAENERLGDMARCMRSGADDFAHGGAALCVSCVNAITEERDQLREEQEASK